MSAATIYQSYYTKSEPIINYMTGMLNIQPQDSIWEPCGGDGVFVDKILEQSPFSNICIYEYNPKAVSTLRKKYQGIHNISIKQTDTLLDDIVLSKKELYDKIIGNPPYGARHTEEQKIALSRSYPHLYTKESYTLFLYACIECLKEGGELSFIIPDTFLSLHRHLSIRKYILFNTTIREITLFPSSFFPGINFGYANLCIITLKKVNNIDANLSNKIVIRTGFSNVDDLPKQSSGSRRLISQDDVLNSLDSAFLFEESDRILEIINSGSICRIGDIADCVTGFYSGNDKLYLKPLNETCKNAKKYENVNIDEICRHQLTLEEAINGISSNDNFVPIVKGGNKKYIKPNEWFMNWSTSAIKEFRRSPKCRFQNSNYYFSEGIAIPMVRSKHLTAALLENRLFDQSIVGVFPKDKSFTLYLLAFFNSSICSRLINAINPSTNNSANYIKKIPFIIPSNSIKEEVDDIVKKIIKFEKQGNSDIYSYEKELNNIFETIYAQQIDNIHIYKRPVQLCLYD